MTDEQKQEAEPFAAIEFVEQVTAGVPWAVLGRVAHVLDRASVDLNNDGILLPESDWRALRAQCDLLKELSEAYAKAAVEGILAP